MARRVRVEAEKVDLLGGLNPEQRDVVLHDEGPLRVGAVAGAGKTTALTRRIAYLVLERGVLGSRILAVTFSKKGADEMNERLDKLVPGSGARVGTVHSVANQFMREEVVGFRQEMVDDRGRYELCVKDAISSRVLRNARGQEICRAMGWKDADLTFLISFIGLCKARCFLAGGAEAKAFAQELYQKVPVRAREPQKVCEVYSLAERLRADRQLVTFDDMLLEMWRRLSDDAELLARWSARWDYVLQDEAQDENPVQGDILAMLAYPHRNYMVVGDPAQSIYAFRGSSPKGLLDFGATWEASTVQMHRNYRCGRAIAAAANGVLAAMPDETRISDGGSLLSITAEREEDGVVEVEEYEDTDAEGEAVAEKMVALHADGATWKSIAALVRANSLTRALEEALLSRRVPLLVLGGTPFYKRREVAALVSYLSVAAGRASFEDVKRSLNAPFRFLGEAFTSKVKAAGEGTSRREGPADWTSIVREVAASGAVQRRQANSAEDWADLVEDLTRTIRAGKDAGAPSLTDDPEAEGLRAAALPAVLLEKLIREACTPDGDDYVRWLTRDEGSESPENNRLSNVRELVRASERFSTVDDLLDYVELQLAPPRADKDADRVTLMSIHRLTVTCARYVALSSGKVRLEPSRFIREAGLAVKSVVAQGGEQDDAAPAAQEAV